jgi:hypothetical protein
MPGMSTMPTIPSAGPGALVIGVTGDALVLRGELSHPAATDGRSPQIVRSVVVDDDLWTVSRVGLGRTAAAAPTGVDLVAF